MKYVQLADGLDIKFILISDGEPNEERATLNLAKQFKSKIHTVYIGPETGSGRKFLERLAEATGGASIKSDAPGLLKDPVERLLLTA